MKIFLISLLTFTFVLSACQKEKVAIDANSDNPFYGTPLDQGSIDVPCTLSDNSIYHYETNTVWPSDNHGSDYYWMHWAMNGYNYYGNQLVNIDFSEAPSSGQYFTNYTNASLGANDCIIRCMVNNTLYVANYGGQVYVKKESGTYKATFCSLQFTSQQGYQMTISGSLKTN